MRGFGIELRGAVGLGVEGSGDGIVGGGSGTGRGGISYVVSVWINALRLQVITLPSSMATA